MSDRPLDPALRPPSARPAPERLHLTISRLADQPHPRSKAVTWRHAVAPVAAASALALGIAGVTQLRPTTQPGPVAGPGSSSAAPMPPASAGSVTALSSRQVSAQSRSCIAEARQHHDAEKNTTWRTVYAQNVSILGTSTASSILILDSGRAYLTCTNGQETEWSLQGEGSKIVPRTPGPATPAVVADGVFNGSSNYAKGLALIQFAARVDSSVASGRVRMHTPDGVGSWQSVPARQGWLIMQVVAPASGSPEDKPVTSEVTAEFQAVDASGHPVMIGASNGEPINRVIIPAVT